MRGLYVIVDVGTLRAHGLDPVRFTQAVLGAAPVAVQLRAKELPSREVLALLRTLAPMCRRVGVPLVANDRADLAVFAGCDMVHVGQDDTAIELVRRIAPNLGVGISTHNLEQLEQALEHRPTYVAFGPIYPTMTKQVSNPIVGLELLEQATERARRVGVPLVAIGGITSDRVVEVARRADACACVSALLPPAMSTDPYGDTLRRAQVLKAAFGIPQAAE
ncbi:MAG: thiamine phosphate synthase [Myxococcales bacterium]